MSKNIFEDIERIGGYPYQGDICKHHKGGSYKLICYANNESNAKAVTVYFCLETGKYWVRPTVEFLDKFTFSEVSGEGYLPEQTCGTYLTSKRTRDALRIGISWQKLLADKEVHIHLLKDRLKKMSLWDRIFYKGED